MTVSTGAVIGGYRIERVLGTGGMGSVYLAAHPTLPRFDALKVLQPQLSSDPEYRARFIREANIVAGLTHPNIVSVYDRGEDQGYLWIAMQYVEGVDAGTLLAQDPQSIPPQRALHIIGEIGKGLDYAHQHGLLHRDVKPSNFLLSSRDWRQVLLSDFGIAKSAADATELTRTGGLVATLAYASPEQLRGQAVDHRSDIYSLACSLYKLLTGQNPYPATEAAQVMHAHLYSPPPRVTVPCPHLPPALDEILAIALAKHPADRFVSCHELVSAVGHALEGPTAPVQHYAPPIPTMPAVGPVPPAFGTGVGPNRRRRKTIAITAAAGVAVAAVAAAGFVIANRDTAAGGKTGQAITEIPVGSAMDGTMDADPSTHSLYLANPSSNSVTVIDMTSNKVTATIPVGENPRGVAVDSVNRTVYVVNSGSNSGSTTNAASTVSIIDTSTNKVTATVPTGKSSWNVAVDTKTHLVYVVDITDPAIAPNDMSSDVSVIDPATKTVVATIPHVGFQSEDVAVDPTTGMAYVTSFSDGSVKVVDTTSRAVVSSIQPGGMPGRIALDPSSHTAYVTSGSGLAVVDTITNTRSTIIPADCRLHGVTVDPGHAVYAACTSEGVVVIDPNTRTIRETLSVPSDVGIAADPGSHILYVYGGGYVSAIKR
ncbi:serine/threonine-protein kinase [Nocardia sp. NPDC051030]|uniref:serine/threonine-protein kinase n=1 Tax=Nocardia sp. NPDC051030 TaxID=3155162 RepID=UPI003415A165